MHIFRGHNALVLSVGVSTDRDVVYSCSADSQPRLWQSPTNVRDPFDFYGKILFVSYGAIGILYTS